MEAHYNIYFSNQWTSFTKHPPFTPSTSILKICLIPSHLTFIKAKKFLMSHFKRLTQPTQEFSFPSYLENLAAQGPTNNVQSLLSLPKKKKIPDRKKSQSISLTSKLLPNPLSQQTVEICCPKSQIMFFRWLSDSLLTLMRMVYLTTMK